MLILAYHISRLYTEIRGQHDEDYAKAIISFLAVTFDRVLGRMSSLCIWDNQLKVSCKSLIKAKLSMRWDFVEMNPLSSVGSGWSTSQYYIDKVIRHCASTSTRLLNSSTERLQELASLPSQWMLL